MKINYEEKQYDIEFEGKLYTLAKRTKSTMEAVVSLSKKSDMSEYDNNMELLRILIGKEKAKEMFPGGEDTNLDKLAYVSNCIMELFMREYKELQQQRVKKDLAPLVDVANNLRTAKSITRVQK